MKRGRTGHPTQSHSVIPPINTDVHWTGKAWGIYKKRNAKKKTIGERVQMSNAQRNKKITLPEKA